MQALSYKDPGIIWLEYKFTIRFKIRIKLASPLDEAKITTLIVSLSLQNVHCVHVENHAPSALLKIFFHVINIWDPENYFFHYYNQSHCPLPGGCIKQMYQNKGPAEGSTDHVII